MTQPAFWTTWSLFSNVSERMVSPPRRTRSRDQCLFGVWIQASWVPKRRGSSKISKSRCALYKNTAIILSRGDQKAVKALLVAPAA